MTGVIFDLDGTLLDTLADLHAATNAALAHFGYPPHTRDAVRRFVGNGAGLLIARAVPAGTDKATAEAVLAAFQAYYGTHCADQTQPYPGIPELLDALHERGIRTACITNKDHTDAAPMLQKFFGEGISHVEGRKPGRPTKPAPDAVYDALKALGADPSRALYVGDSGVDSETAKNASLPCVLCDWGYWDRDRLENCAALGVISAPAELLQYV